eukprot:15161217-Alexandrium_andersonii.AAC.1
MAGQDRNALSPARQVQRLLVVPIVYRTWAKLRLAQMSVWLQATISPAMFAGVKGRGAQDAWMRTARAIE